MYYDFVIASLFWNTKMLVRVYLGFLYQQEKNNFSNSKYLEKRNF